MSRLRILFVVRKLDVGGMERMAIDLMTHLDPGRYTPLLCTIEDPGELATVITKAGIEIVPLNKKSGIRASCVWSLRELLVKRKVELIHTHNETAHFYGAIANTCRSDRVPLIHTKHGRGEPEHKRSVLRNRLCSLMSDAVVAVSDDVKQVCHVVERVPLRKLKTIVNGVPLEPYITAAKNRTARDDVVFGHVGRLSEVKNQQLLLRAFSRLVAEFPRARLTVVGDGPLRTELEQLAGHLGIVDKVTFTGYQADIPSLMSGFDCFVMSSVSEGLPLVVIEAMAAQCPVVGTDVGGMREIVAEGQTGYLVDSGDEDALVRRLLDVARDPDRRRVMGVEGQILAQSTYGLPTMVAEYEALYQSLTGR